MPAGPRFSVWEIPFSYYGSWFGISPVTGQHAYADDLHLVSHRNGLHPVLALRPLAGAARAETEVTTTPSMLSWLHGTGRIDLVYESVNTVRVRGSGLAFCVEAAAGALTPFTGSYLYRDPAAGGKGYVFASYETGQRYLVTVLAGADIEVVGSQALGEQPRKLLIAGGEWELAITEVSSVRAPYAPSGTFAQAASHAGVAFAAFADAVAPWRSERTPAAELAAYVLWSATVSPAGFLRRPAVLMSKHWMDKVWSWDHCFNAIALAAGKPDLARDQYLVMFDHQDESGALPDSVTHSEVLYNFVKPPIHGWALGQLIRRLPAPLPAAELDEIYFRLARWATFWLDSRRAPGSELPYYQHGNDSGWDNATTFDVERVVESADLAAFLILLLHELAELALRLERGTEARDWRSLAEQMTSVLLGELWTGERFQARGVESGQARTTASLLDLMPIVLGEHLPEAVRAKLGARIATHLTDYGPATELPSSPHYSADGYWRGPVWAPATLLVEDGLRRAGQVHLADEISARFRALCEKSGFAENFDALTGAGQRDRAYTWTASSYLILAADFERRRAAPGHPSALTGAAGPIGLPPDQLASGVAGACGSFRSLIGPLAVLSECGVLAGCQAIAFHRWSPGLG